MGDNNRPGRDWLLITATRADRVPEHFHPVLDSYLDIADQERRHHVPDGTPILVSPDLEIDPRLVEYFARSDHFTGQDRTGRLTYAREIRAWLDFLWDQDIRWDEATEDNYIHFKNWRLDPDLHEVDEGEDAPVIQPVTFRKIHAALKGFYDWAASAPRNYVSVSPIPTTFSVGRGNRQPAADNVRSDRSRWVTPATYRTWRDVGLLGYRAKRAGRGVIPGEHQADWRGGVQQSRNRAYCDVMVTSALRRTELASLLVVELPSVPSEIRLGEGVAKYGRARMWTPLASGLMSVQQYVDLQRAAAVRRAQRLGRYDSVDNPLWVTEVESLRQGLAVRVADGGRQFVADLDEDERLRLFRRGSDGAPEPMALWLGVDGLPMRERGWNDVFEAANDRVESEFVRLGFTRDKAIRLSPHSLRFSFALYLLAALHRRIDEQAGYRATDPYDASRYEQAYDMVRDLLGHARVQTTKDIYLEPVKGMRRALLFDAGSVDKSLNEIIESIAGGDSAIANSALLQDEDTD